MKQKRRRDIKIPVFLYHKDFLGGIIFDAADPEYAGLEAKGWVDSPAKLFKEPEKPAEKEPIAPAAREAAEAAEKALNEERHCELMERFAQVKPDLTRRELIELAELEGLNPDRRLSAAKIETIIQDAIGAKNGADSKRAD